MTAMNKTNKHYVSNIDIRLAEFNRTHKQSASQQAEIKKYKRIYQLRDHALLLNHASSDLFDFSNEE